MKQVSKTSLIILIASLFLLPGTMAIESGSTDSEKELAPATHSLELKKTESIYKTYDLRDEAYLTYSPSEETRTRAEGDLTFESNTSTASLSDAPFQLLYYDDESDSEYGWGVKDEEITYEPNVKNTGTGQVTFTLRLVITEAIVGDDGDWIINIGDDGEFENITKIVGPLPGGTNTSTAGLDTSLSWTPDTAGRVFMHFSIEYNLDPDLNNNNIYLWPYIMHVYNTVETQIEQDEWKAGNGWDTTQLSENIVWECGPVGVQHLEYAADLSNCKDDEIPLFGKDPEWGTRGAFIGWGFSGSAALSTWTFEFWNSTSQSWDGKITDTSSINDGWYYYVYGDYDVDGYQILGSFVDQNYCTKDFKVRITGSNLYIDDLWLISLEYLVPRTPPEPILSFEVDFRGDENYGDLNSNSIKDQALFPSTEYSWNFTLTNTATSNKTGKGDPFGATIETSTFTVKEKPDNWNIVFAPSSISTEIAPGESKNFTMNVSIPIDAKASAYYKSENNDWNPYFIEFGTTALPVTTDPEAIPSSLMRNITVETLVHEVPEIDVSATSATNISAKTGSKLEYIISIVNTGNCNNSITVRAIKPSGFVEPIDIDKKDFDLEVGEEKSVEVTVYIPPLINAGSYSFDVSIETVEIEYEYMSGEAPSITETVNLIATVEQNFGILVDLKDSSQEQIEIDTAKAGSMVQLIELDVTNNGNGRDSATFSVKANDTGDKDWYDMGVTNTVELGPTGGADNKKEFSIEFAIPEDASAGEHMFSVKAVSVNDPNGENSAVEKKIIFTVLRPDIDLDPVSPFKGKVTHISVKVYNNGTTSASGFSVNLYIDDDLVDFRPVNGLAKGENTHLTPFEYVFEDTKEYTIKVLVDLIEGIKDKGNVTEIDEQNNEVSRTVEVIAPELQFDQDVLVSTGEGVEIIPGGEDRYDVMKDETYKIGVMVMNKGKAESKAVRVNLKVYYMDSMGNEIQGNEENLTLPSISAGERKLAEFTWIPDLYGTDYYLKFSVDPENKIFEENDENNKWVPDENFITDPQPIEDPNGMGMTTIIVIVVVIVIAAIVAVLLVLSRRKK